MSSAPRLPHATKDLDSRARKARKIEWLLALPDDGRPLRLLEVGAGSGGISQYFAHHPSNRFEVQAVDVVDGRETGDGYDFRLVNDSRLPFEDESFDVVISNHVIEHVGGRSRQLRHLRELGRVLRKDGAGYLAVPNRWMIIEPHYALPFLSWLPRSFRDRYLSLAGRGEHYDCEPLQAHELHALLHRAGLAYRHREIEALRAIAKLEAASPLVRALSHLPPSLMGLAQPLLPTFICIFNRQHDPADKR